MARPRVYLSIPVPERQIAFLRERCEVADYGGPLTRDGLISGMRDAEGLLISAALPVDSRVLEAAPQLRVVSNFGVGYDHVDLQCATRRGILVTNTPGILSAAVAELTIALILNLARRLPEATRVVSEGAWDRFGAAVPLGSDLAGKTLAIIGMGRIGHEVARLASLFHMRIVYHDVAPVAASGLPASPAGNLDEALRHADFVSIHTNLTPRSRHLIGAKELALMKPGAYLINTSRGAVVDQSALCDALKHGRLAGAALDVLEEEPPPPDEPLLKLPNVIITPHIASATRETRAAMMDLAVRNLTACLFNEPCDCIVNRPV